MSLMAHRVTKERERETAVTVCLPLCARPEATCLEHIRVSVVGRHLAPNKMVSETDSLHHDLRLGSMRSKAGLQ